MRKLLLPAIAAASFSFMSTALAESPLNDVDRAARDAADAIMGALGIFVGAIPQYEAPEVLENGDILIRRKPSAGDADRPEPKPDMQDRRRPGNDPRDDKGTST